MSTKDHPANIAYLALLDVARFVLPKRKWADNLYIWLRFLVEHGRAPTQAMRYNDALYRHAISGALEHPLVIRTTCKYKAKSFLVEHFDEGHVIPSLAVLTNGSDIDQYDFPEVCVIKGTSASGQFVLKSKGQGVDRRQLKKWLRINHYDLSREANYAPNKNAIIVEPAVFGTELRDDLKFICWKGKARWIFHSGQVEGTKKSRLLTTDWKVLPVGSHFPHNPDPLDRPACLNEMLAAAEKIAAHFNFVRVDFFYDGPDWVFGEITHLDGGGYAGFIPLSGEALMNWLTFGDDAYTGPIERHGALGARHREDR